MHCVYEFSYWRCNFPFDPHVCLLLVVLLLCRSVGWVVRRLSVCNKFLKGWKFTNSGSYGTLIINTYAKTSIPYWTPTYISQINNGRLANNNQLVNGY